MVCSSTCLVMSSSLCIAPWFLKSTSAGACTAKTLCWPAVITAKQIFVKKYRTMVIIISKSRFGSISIDRISTASSFWTFCSLTSNLKSDDPNTTRTCYVSTLHAFYPISNYWFVKYRTQEFVQVWVCWLFQEQLPFDQCMESNVE